MATKVTPRFVRGRLCVVFYLRNYFSVLRSGDSFMHMADALISPVVGGVMWAVSAGAASYAAHKLKNDLNEKKVPLMGVLGAFIFAAQMINFTIPGTGSSGHLVGGLLLSILAGPHAAFLTIISILTVQALFFADGGLLALGCNIINMGFFPCYLAYPLFYKPLIGKAPGKVRLSAAAVISSVIGLQFGAFSVVLETVSSGITALPFSTFVLLMLPIHLAIGAVEGLITAAVICFIRQEAPSLLDNQPFFSKKALSGFLAAAILVSGMLSWAASTKPDGLEWSIAAVTGEEELTASGSIHDFFADLQKKTAFFPDYNFKDDTADSKDAAASSPTVWPAVDAGSSAAGVTGAIITLLLVFGAGKAVQFATKH